MALRDQPYLPLYIQDFLTDEKLAQCSAKSTGVYIRLICLMHKSENYGKILLKQKYKQTHEQVKNFASQLVKHLPYDFHTVTESLEELLDEKVLIMEGDILIQKRMVKDNEISELRSKAGKIGGEKSRSNNKVFADDFAKAKIIANSESEYEIGIETEIKNESFGKSENLLQEVERVFTQQGGTKEMAKAFYEKHSATGWVVRGSPIKDFSFLVPSFITNWNEIKNKNGFKSNSASNATHGLTYDKP